MNRKQPNRAPRTARTTVRRHAERGQYDRETIFSILDEALICHVGFVEDGQPFVIPTIHVRIGNELYFHGSNASRLLQAIGSGVPVCITATLVDGLVLARSAFDHSMNYRSVVVLGTGQVITDQERKLRVLAALSEHVVPGRWKQVRQPTEPELNATTVVCLPIREASAKIRSGGPKDQPGDYGIPVWAGVLPLSIKAETPLADPRLASGIGVPDYLVGYRRGTRP